jgi:hypothetical protein
MASRYNGLSSYCYAQTALDTVGTLAKLHEAFNILASGWAINPKRAGEVAPVIPLEMLIISNDIQNYDPNLMTRLPLLEQSLKLTEAKQPFKALLNGDQQQLLAIERIDASQFAWTQLPEYSSREAAGNSAIEQFEELRHTIKDASDPRIPALAFWIQLESWYLLPASPYITDQNENLAKIKATKDHLALGSQTAAMLRAGLDKFSVLEDPVEASKLLQKIRDDTTKGLEELRYFKGARRFRNSAGYILWNLGDVLAFYSRWFSKTPDERLRLVRESVDVSSNIAEQSPPTGVANQSSNLGFYLHYLATLEEDKQKRHFLEEAWKAGLRYEQSTQAFYGHWDWGDAEHYYLYGQIKRETARLSSIGKDKVLAESVGMFQKAADTARSVLDSTLALEPNLKKRILSRYLLDLGSTQLELYQATRDPILNDAALRNLEESGRLANVQTLPTRAAESLIKLADAYTQAGKFEQGNRSLLEASKHYDEAATKYPGLSADFHNRARQLESRAYAILAQASYFKNDYKAASELYRKAGKLIDKTTSANLTSFFEAWALACDAEELSQTDPENANKTLALAAEQFSATEKASDTPWSRLATLGREYVESRLLLDRAHLLERQGQLGDSINQLSKAADRFDGLASSYDDVETHDMMRGHALVCRATQAMLEAEQTLRPDHYDKAASLFEDAKKASRTRSFSSLIGGWAACCRALAIGMRYKDNPEPAEFQKMKRHLAIAHSNFTDAGSSSSATWLAATGRMYDAIAYLAEAESTLNLNERNNQYRHAEDQIRRAIEMFHRSGYTAREQDAERLLQSINEKHTTISLGPIPVASIAQSTASITNPSTLSQSLMSRSEEPPLLHAALRAPESPLHPEKETQLTLSILNPSQTRISLLSVENLSHSGLAVQSDERDKMVHGGLLNLNGKRLSPLESFQIKLRARPSHPGKHVVQPTIRFVNSYGQEMTYQSQPLILDVAETGLRAWLRGPQS